MNKFLIKALIHISWIIPISAAVGIGTFAFITIVIPDLGSIGLRIALISIFIVIFLIPWVFLAYILHSKKFGIAVNLFWSAVLSMVALECSRCLLVAFGIFKFIDYKEIIRNSCKMPDDLTPSVLHEFVFTCATTTWLSTASASYIRVSSAGLVITLTVICYKYFSKKLR